MKKISKITTINFVMTCLIVFYHCVVSVQPSSLIDKRVNEYITQVIEQSAKIAMSYFFCITAFLLFRGLTFENYYLKIKKRFSSLLIPYFFWQFSFLFLLLISGKADSPLENIKKIFLFEQFPPDGPLWYLYAVFFLALISPVFLFLFKKQNQSFAILVIIYFLIFWITHYDKMNYITHYGFIYNIFMYLYSYILGAYYGIHCPDMDDYHALRFIVFLLLIGFIFSVGFFDGFEIKIILSAIPILVLFFFPNKLSKEKQIYKTSFIMFAIHQPIFGLYSGLIRFLFIKLGLSCSVINICSRIIGLFITFLLAFILHSFLKKKYPIFLKTITGGRI